MVQPSEHVLRAPQPIRAYAIAAASAVVGALLLVLGSALNWPVVVPALGAVVLVGGLALAIAALLLVRRSAVWFWLDTEGYRIDGPGGQVAGSWAGTQKVTMSSGGHRITLVGETDRQVLSPAPAGDPRVRALIEDLKRRLDANRGYSSPTLDV